MRASFRPLLRGALLGLGLAVACAQVMAQAPPDEAPVDYVNPQTFTFLFENDLFGESDEQYTNGLKLSWLSSDLKALAEAPRVPPWLIGMVERLKAFERRSGIDSERQFNLGLAVGQMMYTPENIEASAQIDDDRPYAGWLYGSLTFVSKTDRIADTLEIQAGVIGPAAQAEEAQDLVHDIRDLPHARGWDNQLSNEPGLMLYYERKWRMLRHDLFGEVGFDIITHSGVALGNVMTYAAAGAEARLGFRLPYDFGTALIRPGGDANAPTTVGGPAGRLRGFGVYGFAGAGGRLIGRDIFLDGNTFEDSHDVDKKWAVGDLVVGASVIFGATKLSYAQVFRTRQFDGQPHHHNFGSISLSLAF